MSDIVERLRHHAKVGDGWTRPVASEAADEIDRLRSEVEGYRATMDAASDDLDKLAFDRDRLRAALRNAADVIENYSPEVITSTVWLSSHETLVDYLRATLKDAKP
jgi:hypothetical protein